MCNFSLHIYIRFFFKVLFSLPVSLLSFKVKELNIKGKQSKPGVRTGAVEQRKAKSQESHQIVKARLTQGQTD